MKLYTVDAFTDVAFGGNPAGVAIFDNALPSEDEMRAIAAKVGYSETAFILPLEDGSFKVRFFTPVEEVPLCGHATVASFALMLEQKMIEEGKRYIARTGAGDINVDIQGGLVWLDMASPREITQLSPEDTQTLLSMYALPADACGDMLPAIVNAGLPDIMLPLKSRELLAAMNQDADAVTELSRGFEVTGIHAVALGDATAVALGDATAVAPNDATAVAPNDATAVTLGDSTVTGYCRNFAPLYGIIEEAATGTSNGALTWYLYNRGLVKPGEVNLFIQGESMGKPSKIYTRLTLDSKGEPSIRVAGSGVVRK